VVVRMYATLASFWMSDSTSVLPCVYLFSEEYNYSEKYSYIQIMIDNSLGFCFP